MLGDANGAADNYSVEKKIKPNYVDHYIYYPAGWFRGNGVVSIVDPTLNSHPGASHH